MTPPADPAANAPRDTNLMRVVAVLREQGRLTRAEVSEATGLSRTTVSGILNRLRDYGLVVENTEPPQGAAVAGGLGRPPTTVALDLSAGAAVGVDIGRRHIRVTLADLGHQVLAQREARFDVDGRADQALALVATLVGEAIAASGVAPGRILGLGLGLPAPIDSDGRIGSSKILPGWTGRAPGPELAARVGLPVQVGNDANLGGLAEALYGAGRGHRHVVYLKLATGIGGALVLDGRLHSGAGGVAGEIGHTTVSDTGAVCRCGNRGCLELVAGGPALLDALRHTGVELSSIADVIERAQAGHAGCRRVIEDTGALVGVAVANTVKLIDPSIVIIGGELAAAGDLLLGPIRAALRQAGLAGAEPLVAAAVLGEAAESLGGVLLVLHETDKAAAEDLVARLMQETDRPLTPDAAPRSAPQSGLTNDSPRSPRATSSAPREASASRRPSRS
jgi:predicted NBD/HSP70 family sugar kinase